MNILETNVKIQGIMRVMENIKKKQMEILESKYIITIIKNFLGKINSRMERRQRKNQGISR